MNFSKDGTRSTYNLGNGLRFVSKSKKPRMSAKKSDRTNTASAKFYTVSDELVKEHLANPDKYNYYSKSEPEKAPYMGWFFILLVIVLMIIFK